MEIIARRQGIGIYLFYLIFGLVMFVIGALISALLLWTFWGTADAVSPVFAGLLILFMGLAFIIVGSIFIALIRETPENVVIREGDEIKYPNGSVKLSELTNAYYRVWARWTWFGPSSGTLFLSTATAQIKIRFVGNLEAVQQRVVLLITENRAQANRQA